MTAPAAAFAAGLFNLAAAIFHVAFWRLFGWPERLATLDAANRSLMQVLNLALIAMFLIVGFVLVSEPQQAVITALGRTLLGGLAAFWLLRAAIQFPFFGLRHPASICVLVACLLGCTLHAAALWLPSGTVCSGGVGCRP